jgi:hypothetical protein
MIQMSEDYINSVAPNLSAVKNGKDLLKKKRLRDLAQSSDGSLLFGECEGSGKENYRTSVDFLVPTKPVFRCSCPSHQFPCKHAIGLMYAWQAGIKFSIKDIPADIQEKREKALKQEEKKRTLSETPLPKAGPAKKVNSSALTKKIKTQLEGLTLLEKITQSVIKGGLAALDRNMLQNLEEQATQLGNYYLHGAQNALREFILLFQLNPDREHIYSAAVQQLTTLAALAKKGQEYLTTRLATPDLPRDKESNIEEWLGHAWQITELKELGLSEERAELIQLFFSVYRDWGRREDIDTGYWINLHSGMIQKTCNYRPFKAKRHIPEEDSVRGVLQTPELVIYPGNINPRVRWQEMQIRDIGAGDYATILAAAQKSYPEVIKTVKNQIKNPLADKHPVLLLGYRRLGKIAEEFVLEDNDKNRILLRDGRLGLDRPSCHMLQYIEKNDLANQALLVRFEHDIAAGTLTAQPLTLVNDTRLVRLIS